jgi:hypothetical protein
MSRRPGVACGPHATLLKSPSNQWGIILNNTSMIESTFNRQLGTAIQQKTTPLHSSQKKGFAGFSNNNDVMHMLGLFY